MASRRTATAYSGLRLTENIGLATAKSGNGSIIAPEPTVIEHAYYK